MIRPTVNIIIADDHEMFRDGFKLMLTRQPDFHLVGEAENGRELVEMTKKFQPDVIITDIKMPVLDGIEATRQILTLYPQTGIIGLSMFDEEELIIDMLEAGAKGYLLKNSSKDQIAEAIFTVFEGHPFYCRTTSKKLTEMIAKSKFNPYKISAKPDFSEREKEIISMICHEMTNKEIAEKLFLSVRTVEGHRLTILEKMNVKNSVGLVIYAIRYGIIKL